MGDNLLSDIMINILSRLPPDSLPECSLVCKTWRHLIYNDKSFARTLSRLIYDQDIVDAVSSGKASFVYLDNSLLKHMEYDDDAHEKSLKFGITNLVPAPDHKPCRIIGSCNGLVCISVFSGKHDTIQDPICICNPMTREFVYLPKLKKMFRPGDYVVSGFGYHPLTNEYKVVRIYFRAAHKTKPFVGRVQVYTLGSGKGWRNLEDITYELHPSVSNEILANGALHWLDENGKLVKFDLSDETFSVIPTPEDVDDMWEFRRKHVKNYSNIFRGFELRVLGGCLRIIRRDSRFSDIFSLTENENNGKQDIEKEDSWEEDTFDWRSLDNDQWTSSVYLFAILKDNATILFHDNHCYGYRKDLAGPNYGTIGHRIPQHLVRFVKSFVSLRALGEEALIMESSEGAQELSSSDLDSDDE